MALAVWRALETFDSQRAIAAKLVAENLGEDSNVVFTDALLHYVGKIVSAEALDTQYEAPVSQSKNEDISLVEAEKMYLEYNTRK